MTIVYFVRHAEPNYGNHNDALRELTAKGLKDRELVTAFLRDKDIDVVLSSPYQRAVDTVRDFAERYGHEIGIVADFRERKVDGVWIDDFNAFSRRQWADFDYKLDDGETLAEVQARNIAALQAVLLRYPGQNVVIGSHGTALSTIINYYDRSFGHADFERIKALMPWIVRFSFQGTDLGTIDLIDVHTRQFTRRYPAAPSRG
jgi:2,3-bisphosphoglycerate-dependent phosphoglycerate mutase